MRRIRLSLLRAKGGMITGDKMSRLQSTGIVDTTGNVKGDYRQVLDTLSRPRTVSTMRYTAGSRLYEFIRKLSRYTEFAARLNSS